MNFDKDEDEEDECYEDETDDDEFENSGDVITLADALKSISSNARYYILM